MTTVIIAFAANLLIAIAKSVAAALTSSASMLAEAAHSWADTGNEIFLLIAERKSDRGRDRRHPMGYGKEAYVWSMFAAFGLFTAGAVVSIFHGISELRDPEPAADYGIAYVVLSIAFVLEGISFVQAFRQTRRKAVQTGSEHWSYVLNTSNPTLRAVFFEDGAALIGLLIAGTGIGLHQVTGSPVPDAIGSIAVGILLAVVAVVLIQRNRSFLIGQSVRPAVRDAVLTELLSSAEIERVTYLHVEFVGPERVYLVAAVDLSGDEAEHDLAVRLRRIERELEKRAAVEEAVLTLATADEPSLEPTDG
ncbi:MAG: cation diffusion facilitator family transporter [Microlunatus sp.]|nr:cation diffusion facilitator family transporter [Microlunatus sp.]MDN5770543.1 cation diffusion facilitator family transporter [Microlunatus sp.]MDN5804589.1 cation diffusion facilitator family transporter [Microlunatus sp.]